MNISEMRANLFAGQWSTNDTLAILSDLEKAQLDITRLAAENAASKWVSVSELKSLTGKMLVTNNIDARNASGEMSHLWLVNMIHKSSPQDKEIYGEYFAFDESDRRIGGITHAQLPTPPAGGENGQ